MLVHGLVLPEKVIKISAAEISNKNLLKLKNNFCLKSSCYVNKCRKFINMCVNIINIKHAVKSSFKVSWWGSGFE
jgi:hypothetical protein